MIPRSIRRERGMTVLETMFAASIGAAMFAAGFTFIANMRQGSAATSKRSALACKAAEVVERLARELAVAGMNGEDANKNKGLDAGEDVDRDGRLDADWNLADAATAGDFSFNQRRSDWTWSGAIRWRVNGDALERTEDGATVEMARGVQTFEVARTGDEVTVRLSLTGKDAAGQTQTQSAERRVYVRN